jgi:hypothetical protein
LPEEAATTGKASAFRDWLDAWASHRFFTNFKDFALTREKLAGFLRDRC